MQFTTIGIDLAKSVFQVSIADHQNHILKRQRLSRSQFHRLLVHTPPANLVMEGCASAHHWSRLAELIGQQLLAIPGIGPTIASAALGRVSNIHAFKRGRTFASWLGLTPREYSSGTTRRMGRISRQGDAYLRMLLIHGARSALLAAKRTRAREHPLTELQRWTLAIEARIGHNKATVALANKMARILWAVCTKNTHFNRDHAARYH